MLENNEVTAELVLPFYNVDKPIMELIVKYLTQFDPDTKPNKPITTLNCTLASVFPTNTFAQDFFGDIEDEDLADLVNAANFMNIPKL